MSLAALLLENTIKTSIVIVAALGAVACLRRRSAALRHWLLSAAIVAAAASPILGLVTPAWHLPLDALPRPRFAAPAGASVATRMSARSASIAPRSESAEDISYPTNPVVVIERTWIAGAAISLLILCVGLGRLAWIASSAR